MMSNNSSSSDLVKDWLRDCKRLTGIVDTSPSSSPQNSNRGEASPATLDAIFRLLDDPKVNPELLEGICDQLYTLYRSRDVKLQRQAICFLPSLIGLHLDRLKAGLTASRDKKYQCVDVILLGIYNLEVVDEEGNPVERKFRIPVLSKPSVYHELSAQTIQSQTSAALTEHALQKLESGPSDNLITSFGPFPEFDQICASTRMIILTVLLKIYNQNLSSVPKASLRSICRTVLKVIPCTNQSAVGSKGSAFTADYISSSNYHSSAPTIKNSSTASFIDMISKAGPRIHLSSDVLVELSYAVYFCLYNDVVLEGRRALDRIHSNAVYHLYPDVLLMTNSMRNSLRINLSYQESQESPLDYNISTLSPTSSVTSNAVTTGVSKTAITNASFRTRKLPEDIPIIATNVVGANLTSIDEGEEAAITPPALVDSTKSHRGFGTAAKEALSSKNSILHLLQKKDRKSRDSKKSATSQIIKEEPSLNLEQLDVASVSSGISDSKSFTSDMEMIPLNSLNNRNNIMPLGPTLSVNSASSNASTTTQGTSSTANNNLQNNHENNGDEETTSDSSEGEASVKPLIHESNGTDGPAISA